MEPLAIQLVVTVVSTVASVGAVGIGGWIAKEIRVVKNRQKHTHFEVRAMDKALETSIGNGYSGHRKEELERLIKEDVFVRTGE